MRTFRLNLTPESKVFASYLYECGSWFSNICANDDNNNNSNSQTQTKNIKTWETCPYQPSFKVFIAVMWRNILPWRNWIFYATIWETATTEGELEFSIVSFTSLQQATTPRAKPVAFLVAQPRCVAHCVVKRLRGDKVRVGWRIRPRSGPRRKELFFDPKKIWRQETSWVSFPFNHLLIYIIRVYKW